MKRAKRTAFQKYWMNLPTPRVYLATKGTFSIEQLAELKNEFRSAFNSGLRAGKRKPKGIK